MASFIFPDKHTMAPFVLLYFVLMFCCHVSCVLVNVTRKQQDIFSYPGIRNGCYQFCIDKHSSFLKGKGSICYCECLGDYKTFVTAELKCAKDKDIRNTSQASLKFQLYKNEQPEGRLEVVLFDSITRVMFLPPNNYDEICDLNDVEELHHENLWEWNSVKDEISNYSIIEIDDDDIDKRFTWLDKKYEGWMMLELDLGVSPDRFVGRIMRINVTCENSNKNRKDMTGVMVFKVNGTFRVPDDTIPSSTLAPVKSSTYYLTPTSSMSSVFVTSTTSTMLSTVVTSSPLIPVTSSLQPVTSSSLQPVTSSSLQPMTSSSFQTMMSSSLQTMMSSSLQTMKPSSTIYSSMSSPNVLTESVTDSSTLSSMAFRSSSMVMVGPAKTSKSSSNGAVTGGVVAGVVVLLVVVVFVVYILRKRRLLIIRQKPFWKKKDLGHVNPNYPSLSSLQVIPALNNPLNDGIYENPEVVNGDTNRRSGITAIDSAAYDSCIIVENPSADEKVKSVYDNIPDPAENTYKALDPAKREPSAKYQSLIKNDNEYSTVADGSGSSNQEPLYSEVDRLPLPLPMRNDHAARGPTPPPFTSRKSYTPAVAEPIYNELENSGGVRENGNLAPSLPPRQPRIPAVAEPVYNELENSGRQAEENENGPEQSN